jgi:hypothetical protein
VELQTHKLLEVELEVCKLLVKILQDENRVLRLAPGTRISMADGVTGKISDPLNTSINSDVNAVSECLSCASIAVKEVRDAACDDYRQSNGRKVKFQTVNNQTDEQAAGVEEFQHKGKDSSESNTRTENYLMNE